MAKRTRSTTAHHRPRLSPHRAPQRALPRDPRRGARADRRRAPRAGDRHVGRLRERPPPRHRATSTRLGGEDDDERGARGARRAPARAPGGHRPAGPREAHPRARLPARRRRPRRRAPREVLREIHEHGLMARSPAGPDGLAVVDKAAGWTSHDVVAKARGVLGTRKVGHAGTLDPDATGVLLLGVGRVTRLLRFLGLPPKTYTGEIVLGIATSHARRVRRGHRHLGHGRRRRSTTCAPRPPALTGDILQVPADGVGDPGRRPAAARAGPRGDRGRARGAAGHRPPLRGGRAGRARAASRSRSPARRAPTSARSPPTSAPRSAAAPTSATCAAPRSGRSPSTRPCRSRRSTAEHAAAAGRGAARPRRASPSTTTSPPTSATARCSSATGSASTGDGPWAVVDEDGAPARRLRGPPRHARRSQRSCSRARPPP